MADPNLGFSSTNEILRKEEGKSIIRITIENSKAHVHFLLLQVSKGRIHFNGFVAEQLTF
jgi:hypothetical protein